MSKSTTGFRRITGIQFQLCIHHFREKCPLWLNISNTWFEWLFCWHICRLNIMSWPTIQCMLALVYNSCDVIGYHCNMKALQKQPIAIFLVYKHWPHISLIFTFCQLWNKRSHCFNSQLGSGWHINNNGWRHKKHPYISYLLVLAYISKMKLVTLIFYCRIVISNQR